jgi:PAT family acetyl-CoA transporter-like MFS transporter 1
MLSPGSVDLASVCNTAGQSAGYFTSFVLFLILNNPEACNRYLRWWRHTCQPQEGQPR